MMQRAAGLFLAIVLCLPALASAQPLDAWQEAGRRLFVGLPATLPDGGGAKGPRHACSGCHGRDARGGREGDVPPIRWTDLAARGYDADAFGRAVTDGIAVDGRALSRLMPRLALSGGQLAALRAYLRTGTVDQTRGVSADSIRFGVSGRSLAPAQARLYADTLRHALTVKFWAAGIFGRQALVEVIPPDLSPDEIAARYFAVLAIRDVGSTEAVALAEHGVPVLFPFAPLTGREDATLVRGFSASWQNVLRRLAEDIAGNAPAAVVIVAGTPGDSKLAEFLANHIRRRLGGEQPEIVRPAAPYDMLGADTLVLFDAPAAGLPPTARRVYMFTSRLSQVLARAPAADVEMRLVVEAPLLLEASLRSGQDPVEVHAEFGARVLAVVLAETGRSLTRAGLVGAFDQAEFPAMALDYRKNRLSGNGDVRFLDLTGRSRQNTQ